MQQCHPWQKLKLGCSRKIIRDKDSLAKNPSCVGLLFPNEEGRTPFLHLEVAESAALKAVLHLLCKISSQNEPLLTRVKTPKSSCYCIPPAAGGGEQTQSCIPKNFLLSSISFNSICSVCFAEGFLWAKFYFPKYCKHLRKYLDLRLVQICAGSCHSCWRHFTAIWEPPGEEMTHSRRLEKRWSQQPSRKAQVVTFAIIITQ